MRQRLTLPLVLLMTACLMNSDNAWAKQAETANASPATAVSPEVAQEETEQDDKKEAEEPPKTLKAKSAPMVAVETIAARVESQSNNEIRIDMDQWTELEVAEVTAQGATVKSGQIVLKFDTKKFDEKLRQAELDMQLTELQQSLAEAENDYAERTWEMDREMAETDWAEARDDIRFWLDVRKQMTIEAAKRSLENSEHSVEYAQEELNQLEKMYNEDELTEESEKIVLERTKRELEDSQFWLKRSRIETDRELTIEIPRMEQQQQRQLRRGEVEYNKKMIELPAAKKKREIEFDKARFAHEQAVEEYNKLKADREKMNLKAPVDGVLYHGEFKRGAWANSTGSKLRGIHKEDDLTNDVIVMTVVDPGRMQLRCDLTESQIALVKPGTTAHVTAAALPGMRFSATVQSVSQFPVEGENYDCTLSLGDNPQGLRPGMTCEIKLMVYDQPTATVVPTASVFTDNAGISHYVFAWKDGKSVQREVVKGREHDGNTEILSGLNPGEEILESRPEEKSDAK